MNTDPFADAARIDHQNLIQAAELKRLMPTDAQGSSHRRSRNLMRLVRLVLGFGRRPKRL
jgi:hypothetical protein